MSAERGVEVPKVLIAGIGNELFGDDGFGVEVARRMQGRLPTWAEARAFGVRSLDLAYALMDGPELAILVDAMPRGGAAGTLYLIEPTQLDEQQAVTTHGLDPVRTLRMVRSMTGQLPPVAIVGCEPSPPDVMSTTLSPPVEAAVEAACRMIEALVAEASPKCTR